MVVTKNKLLKLSLYSIIIALILFLINYYVFHFVTDDGFTLIWHEEAGKPFVSNLIGQLAVLFVFLSGASLLCSFVFFKNEK
jgi:hypothetical protein